MSPRPDLSAQLWNWFVGFWFHMGSTLAFGLAALAAILGYAWLSRRAAAIEAAPAPPTYPQMLLKLLYFDFILAGAFISLAGFFVIFYGLQAICWEFLPQPVESVGGLSFETDADFDAWAAGRFSLALYAAAISLVLVAAGFAYLSFKAQQRRETEGPPAGWTGDFFYNRVFLGVMLAIAAWWCLWNVLMEVASLLLLLRPEGEEVLRRLAFPEAERLMIRFLMGSGLLLMFMLLAPLAWLRLRRDILEFRYFLSLLRSLEDHPFFYALLRLTLVLHLSGVGSYLMFYLALYTLRILLVPSP